MGNYRESGEVLFMKNGMKKTAAVVMAAMLMGTGAVVPAAEDMGIFSQTAIVAEAASVGKVTGLKSKTLSNSEIQLNWSKVKGASGYTVYMRKNGKYNKLGDCKGTSYTVKKLPNATRENFKVRAYKTVKGKKVYGKYSANWNTATNPLKIRACKQDDKKTNNNHYGKYSGVVTATTKKSDKITQADIDVMKKELTAYSREKAEYIKEHYTEFWKYGTDFNTIEEYFELKEKSVTPENAGYDAVYVIPYTQDNLDETIQLYKRKIDYLYEKEGDVYYVVYIENCPNGHRVNSDPCWATYFLY